MATRPPPYVDYPNVPPNAAERACQPLADEATAAEDGYRCLGRLTPALRIVYGPHATTTVRCA